MIHEYNDELTLAVQRSYVAGAESGVWQRILSDLHPKQRAFVEDPSPRKVAEKGRRGGGSYGGCAWLLQDYERWPNSMSLIVALTQESAKNIAWPTLQEMNERYQLGAVPNGIDLSWTFPNGYKIQLKGAKDRAQVEKLRGFAKGCRRIVLEEPGSYGGHLDKQFRYMVQSVLSPQLMDQHHLGGGQMALIGSPGIDPMGFFFEKCNGKDHRGKSAKRWPLHHWTALDNTKVGAAGYLVEDLEDGGHILDDTSPEQMVAEMVALKDLPMSDERWQAVLCRLSVAFRREYLAEWVKDADALCYNATERHMLPLGFELPDDEPWRITIGVDVGWGDGNGFVVAAKSLYSARIVILQAYYVSEMNDAEIAEEINALKKAWHTGEAYVDCGGEGDRLIDNLEKHSCIADRAAKGRKKPRIEYARTLIERTSMLFRQEHCTDLLVEHSALPWSEDRQTHREGFVDDVTDAWLNAVYPLSQQFRPRTPPRPKPGEAGYEDMIEAREKALSVRAGRRIARRQKRAA